MRCNYREKTKIPFPSRISVITRSPMSSTEIIRKLARQRANGSESLRLAWEQALATLPPMQESQLEAIARAAPSPLSARQLAGFLSREQAPAQAVGRFFDEVAESEEPLEEWLKALSVLAGGLRSTAHRPDLRMAMGYLHCCEAVAHTGARYETFPMTVETMLETYGYEGSSDSCEA